MSNTEERGKIKINDKLKTINNNKSLINFINKYKLPKNKRATKKDYTHTCFGSPWGKYKIPDDKMDEFNELYAKLVWKIHLHFIERPKKVGPLLIDIDWDFGKNGKDRVYTLKDIKWVIAKMNIIIKKYYKANKKTLKSFVFEKKTPCLKKNKDGNFKKHKDGFHIVYPFLAATVEMRYLLTNDLKKQVLKHKPFEHIPYTNSQDKVVDDLVVDSTGWTMYGSRKSDGQAYKLSHIFCADMQEFDIKRCTNKYLVKILSNRRYAEDESTILREDLDEYELNIKLDKIKRQYKCGPVRTLQNKNNNNNISNFDIDFSEEKDFDTIDSISITDSTSRDFESASDFSSDADSNADSETDSDADSNADSETDSNADSNADSDADSNADSNADSDADSNADSGSNSDSLSDGSLSPSLTKTKHGNVRSKYRIRNKLKKRRTNARNARNATNTMDVDNVHVHRKRIRKDVGITSDSDQRISVYQRKKKHENKQARVDEIKLASRLVKLLSNDRADSYDTWIRICWCLKNISPKLRKVFHRFSKRSGKYNAKECDDKWNETKRGNFTIGALKCWARKDSPKLYLELLKKTIPDILREAESGTEYDIAKLTHALYGDRYCCASIKHDEWYEFQTHRWVSIERAHTLSLILSNGLSKMLAKLTSEHYGRAATLEGFHREDAEKQGARLTRVIKKLKTTAFKKSVLSECAILFYDPKFKEKLDDNRDLIGFENGVYNLKEHKFRDGVPDDYLTLSVGYDFKEYDMEHSHVKGVLSFLSKIQPEKQMREYVLRLLSSFLDGHARNQQFAIWTGTGCHAPGTQILMYDGSLKKVENVMIGDTIMGNDSTKRTVKHLYYGKDTMYKIIMKRQDGQNESYVVNSKHRLALKLNCHKNIFWLNGTKSGYLIVWFEYDTQTQVPIRTTHFIPATPAEKDTKYKEALKFKKKHIDSSENTIKNGDTVPIFVDYYLRMPFKNMFYGYKESVNYDKILVNKCPYQKGLNLADERIPKKYLVNDTENRLKLLAGIIDANSEPLYRNKYIVNISSEKLIYDVVFLARSLGFSAHIVAHEDILTKEVKNYIELSNGCKSIKDIPVKYGRKQVTSNHITNMYSIDIQCIGEGEYYGFQLDGNQCYLMGDMIPTFNSNGKSTCVEFYQMAFGDYCAILPITVLTRRRGSSGNANPEIAKLPGRRFVVFQEAEHDDQIYVSYMKQMCGNDKMQARALYKEPFEFLPQFNMLLTCNKLPYIPSVDHGTWRRIRVTPFESEFVDHVPKNRNQFKKDKTLSIKLKMWKRAFMWLLLEYYKDVQKDGLREPDKVKMRTKGYRKESDDYLIFIDKYIDVTKDYKNDRETISFLYGEFKEWYRSAHSNSRIPPMKSLEKYFTDNKYKMKRGTIFGIKYNINKDEVEWTEDEINKL